MSLAVASSGPSDRGTSLIALKAVAWRDRDRGDIERWPLLHGDEVNCTRVQALMDEYGAAIDEAERLGEFDALVRRTLGDRP